MKLGKKQENNKKAFRRSLLPAKISLYSLKGNIIGELKAGESVNLQSLIKQPLKAKKIKKKVVRAYRKIQKKR